MQVKKEEFSNNFLENGYKSLKELSFFKISPDKLTKTEESQGDKHFYSIECIDEWDFTLVSWDYEKIEEIVSKLNVGEDENDPVVGISDLLIQSY